MDFDEITRILEMMREHELSEFELERDNVKLRLRKQGSGHGTVAPAYPPPAHLPVPAPASAGTAAAPAAAAGPPGEDTELAIVKSPIVGTFYRASEPAAKPFAEVGDVVKKGQVLCIIEAMKLMNEINAEIDGEVVTVYVENGHAVQFGERLFAIRPA
ncbi:MAG: acetyl-CoA carboxylase biotin carboxyl carrier protein [Acidobacteria bacterium]|nr:acetyl-CoA carboxylase biotin carboxyl carrier protein [Acidobacteriota bacterium]